MIWLKNERRVGAQRPYWSRKDCIVERRHSGESKV